MTDLMYMPTPEQTEAPATIRAVETDEHGTAIVLDRTPFYPQGGGQPSDTGVIEGPDFTFVVRKALLVDGVVRHQGTLTGDVPSGGSEVRARIDGDRRALNTRLHTGGHLVMTAVFELTGLRAMKGYHFPDGPYVEFDGVPDEEVRPELAETLQRRLDSMVEDDEPVLVELTTAGALAAEGVFMPTEVPVDKPTRVVTTCGYRSPCGGTHVASTGELAGLRVRRIKTKGGRLRVAYEIAEEKM